MQREGIYLNWHPPEVDQSFMAVAGGGLGVGFLLLAVVQHSIVASCIGAVGLLLGFSMSIKTGTRIDPRLRVVYREGYLLGRFRLWLKQRPFSEFIAVRYRRVRSGDEDTIFIGLRRQNGRTLEVRYYNLAPSGAGGQARDEARWLANVIGLPLDENEA